jgi:hypothetical protein
MGFLDNILAFFRGLFEALFGVSPREALDQGVAFLAEASQAFLRNIAAAGVKNGAEFIVQLRLINEGINKDHPTMSGSQKREMFLAAARKALEKEGGDLLHDATSSILNTAAELFHQPEVATRVGAPDPQLD